MMTSWQERERLKVLEKRREEHEQYAAERLAKVNEICKLAWLNGMSYGRYIAERSKIMNEEENKVTTEEPKKRGIREPLPPEKIEKVREMLAEGAKVNEIIAETLVSRATIDRIKNGTYGVKQPKKPSKAAEPAVFTALEVSKNDTDSIVLRLIAEAKNNLSDVSAFEHCDCKEVGYAIGLLTAVEMILGDNAK